MARLASLLLFVLMLLQIVRPPGTEAVSDRQAADGPGLHSDGIAGSVPLGANVDRAAGRESGPAAALSHPPSIGLNKFDLFLQYQGLASGGTGDPGHQKVTLAMARKAIADARALGITYLRVAASGYAPDAADRPGHLDLWLTDRATYWALFDLMMNDLATSEIRIIPVFVWNWTQFPAIAGEDASQLITNPRSKSYRLLAQYVTQFVERYRRHPGVLFYELTNELNLLADLNNIAACWEEVADAGRCTTISNFSTDQMIAFARRLAAHIRSLDGSHLISSGFSLPRPSADHLRRRPGWSPDGPDYTPDTLDQFERHLAEIHTELDIVSIHFYNNFGFNERFGISGRWNADLLQVVKRSVDEMGKILFVGEFGDASPTIRDDPRALFTRNTLRELIRLRVPFSAPWVWQFYESAPYLTYDNPNTAFNLEPGYTDGVLATIREANVSLGNPAADHGRPDVLPPRVVVTWPLEGTQTACGQLIHAVASDDGGPVESVSFAIDGQTRAVVRALPYQFTLEPGDVAPGQHVITARAVDAAGNAADYAVSAELAPCQ